MSALLSPPASCPQKQLVTLLAVKLSSCRIQCLDALSGPFFSLMHHRPHFVVLQAELTRLQACLALGLTDFQHCRGRILHSTDALQAHQPVDICTRSSHLELCMWGAAAVCIVLRQCVLHIPQGLHWRSCPVRMQALLLPVLLALMSAILLHASPWTGAAACHHESAMVSQHVGLCCKCRPVAFARPKDPTVGTLGCHGHVACQCCMTCNAFEPTTEEEPSLAIAACSKQLDWLLTGNRRINIFSLKIDSRAAVISIPALRRGVSNLLGPSSA